MQGDLRGFWRVLRYRSRKLPRSQQRIYNRTDILEILETCVLRMMKIGLPKIGPVLKHHRFPRRDPQILTSYPTDRRI